MNYINQNAFSRMKTLKKLYLNHNNLNLLLRMDSPVLFLNGLSELRLLDLSSNGFSNIHVDSFADLRSLNNLYISHNKLMTLSNNLFKPTVRLQYLDLSNNKFNLFNQSMFQNSMPHLEKMAAGGSNPFACTCDLEWFRNWIDSSKVSIVDINECICDSPPAYRNKPILSFHPQDLNCDHKIPLYIWIVIGTGLILTIIITIAIVKKRYYIKYLYYVVRAHTKGYQPLDNEDNNYVYDAFVSHSSEDEKWVKDMREKLEKENGFKLCFHKRDFDIGKPIATNIIESIDASRHTICVITEAFLDSGWCKYELQFALSRLFKERKEVIILIFLQK
ncbi:toll-like receptor 3, partial [Anneissia japonica]|uniref:toll-like receptor 3 n=1 Tax=Anneissia japonica TaxID=1529436 RepID=UPI00142591CC